MFRDRSFVLVWSILILEPRSAVYQELRRFVFDRHFGDLRLDHLMFGYRLAELGTLIGVVDRQLEGAAGDTQGARGTVDARVVELPHAYLEALPFLAEQCVLRNFRTVKDKFAGW